jgi:hypothetical protein
MVDAPFDFAEIGFFYAAFGVFDELEKAGGVFHRSAPGCASHLNSD